MITVNTTVVPKICGIKLENQPNIDNRISKLIINRIMMIIIRLKIILFNPFSPFLSKVITLSSIASSPDISNYKAKQVFIKHKDNYLLFMGL